MKKFRKINFIILFIFISTISINNVLALECTMDNGCRTSATRNGNIYVWNHGGGDSPFGRVLKQSTYTKKTWSYIAETDPAKVQAMIKKGSVHKNSVASRLGYWGFYDKDNYGALFCIDPGHGASHDYYAERFLLDPKTALSVQSMDVALYRIALGFDDNFILPGNDSSLTYEAENFTRTVASRLIVLIYGRTLISGEDESIYVVEATAKYLLEYSPEFKAAYDDLNNELKKHGSSLKSSFNTGGKDPIDVLEPKSWEGAKRKIVTYAIQGMKEGAEFLRNSNQKLSITQTVKANNVKSEVVTDSLGTQYYKDITHVYKVSNLSKASGDIFKIKEVGFKNNRPAGVNAFYQRIKIGDKVYEGGTATNQLLNKNLLDMGFDFKNETTIELTVRLWGWKNYKGSENPTLLTCADNNISYYVDIAAGKDLYSKYSDYIGIVWWNPTVIINGQSRTAQKMVSVEKAASATSVENAQSFKSEYETELLDCGDCKALQKACIESRNINSQDCKDLFNNGCGECIDMEAYCKLNVRLPGGIDACEKHSSVCDVKCDASYTGFECCDSSNNLIVSEADNKEVGIKGPENLKACFVSKIDNLCDMNAAGDDSDCKNTSAEDNKKNKYSLKAMNENKYCSVSCSEDYAMTMPTAKKVNAGRYFTFRAKIKGTKTCYTNTINREQFNKDIKNAQIRLVKAFNEYLRTYTAYNTPIERVTSSCCSECGGTYDSFYLRSTSPYSYNYTENENGIVSVTKVGGLSYSDSSVGSTSCPCNGRCESCHTNKDGKESCHRYCCSWRCGHCTSGRESQVRSRVTSAYNSAKAELSNAQNNFNKIIKDYNACSTWKSNINYNPKVSYDYEENYLENNGLLGEMDVTGDKLAVTKEWYCNATYNTDNTETRKATITGNSYNSCSNTTTGSVSYKGINFMYCTTSGCSPKMQQISNARYKKYSSEINASYKPKTLFYNIYPGGEITKDSDGENTREITNGLPVSLATKRGIYQYQVKIEKLGEFYDKDPTNNLGRYVGGGGQAIVASQILAYNCAYLVNMVNTNGLVCDFPKPGDPDYPYCGDECVSNCVGAGCGGEDPGYCDGTDCIAECVGVGCIYDSDSGSSVNEKSVSLNNLFPNGTNSYNWNKDANSKAYETIKSIQNKGNKAYDEEPILSVTITPSVSKNIKSYNREAENSGGYSNKTLNCYKLGSYERAVCYSEFIGDLLDDKYGNNVINDNSKIADSSYRTGTNVSEASATRNDSYFKMWSGTVNANSKIGPSWK